MHHLLHTVSHHRGYWLALLALGTALIAVALFYQYALGEMPCVLCIQTRIWIAAMAIVALLALLTGNRWINRFAHVLTVICSVGLLERSYQLLGTERGFVFGDCGFDPGLPAWLALDDWLPSLFRVETSCGYTPELLLGVTMAEGLVVLSGALLLISLTLTYAALVGYKH